MAGKDEKAWQKIQKKTFTNWCNNELKEEEITIEELFEGFTNGVNLIILAESLSGKTIPKYVREPKQRIHYTENLSKALDFFQKEEKIKLVNISAVDLADGHNQLTLGLIWTLILHYDVYGHRSKKKRKNLTANGSAKAELLAWINTIIPEKGVTNLTSDWRDGTALASLIEALRPGTVPPNSGDPKSLAEACVSSAEKKMEVPALLSGADLINPACDELSMMTYLSGFRLYHDKHGTGSGDKSEFEPQPQGADEAEKKRQEEEERRRLEDERRRQEEEDRERRRREQEEADRLRREEEERQWQAQEAERRRKEEEARRRAEDAHRQQLLEQERQRKEREAANERLRKQQEDEAARLDALKREREQMEAENRARQRAEEEERRRREHEEDMLRRQEEAARKERERAEEARRRAEAEAEARRRAAEQRRRDQQDELERLRREEERLEKARKEEARQRAQALPPKKLVMRDGTLFVAPDKPASSKPASKKGEDGKPEGDDDSELEMLNMEGASLSKAIDPLDGTVRIAILLKPDDSGHRERIIIEPRPEEVDTTLAALEKQIRLAEINKNKWKPRAYELRPGILRVFIVHGPNQLEHELDIDLTIATIEATKLPNKPFLIKIRPNSFDSGKANIFMEAASAEGRESWINAIRAEMDACKSKRLYY